MTDGARLVVLWEGPWQEVFIKTNRSSLVQNAMLSQPYTASNQPVCDSAVQGVAPACGPVEGGGVRG